MSVRQLCAGLPPEWWSTEDDGARLAMAICRRCHAWPECANEDPAPYGVIRAGTPYSDTGRPYRTCPTCGYPQRGGRVNQPDQCPRCEVPPLGRFRTDIEAWFAAGVTSREIGARIGATRKQIKDARRDWRIRTGRPEHVQPAACPTTTSEGVPA